MMEEPPPEKLQIMKGLKFQRELLRSSKGHNELAVIIAIHSQLADVIKLHQPMASAHQLETAVQGFSMISFSNRAHMKLGDSACR